MAEPLKHSAELSKRSAESISLLVKIKNSDESLKSLDKCLKILAACLCYNMAHAVLISHGNKRFLKPGKYSPCFGKAELCAATKSQQHQPLRVNRLKKHIRFFTKLIVPARMSYI